MGNEKLYISAIGALVSAIIFLVFYVKGLHEKNEKKTAELNKSHEGTTMTINKAHEEKTAELYKRHEERLAEMYREGLKITHETVDAINRNTDAIERIPKNNITINELYQILQARDKK